MWASDEFFRVLTLRRRICAHADNIIYLHAFSVFIMMAIRQSITLLWSHWMVLSTQRNQLTRPVSQWPSAFYMQEGMQNMWSQMQDRRKQKNIKVRTRNMAPTYLVRKRNDKSSRPITKYQVTTNYFSCCIKQTNETERNPENKYDSTRITQGDRCTTINLDVRRSLLNSYYYYYYVPQKKTRRKPSKAKSLL